LDHDPAQVRNLARRGGLCEEVMAAVATGGAGDRAVQMIDSTVIWAPAPKTESHLNALGRSRGGFSTWIHVLPDANGLPPALHLTRGQTADIAAAAELHLRGAHPIIPRRSRRKAPGMSGRRSHARRNGIARMMGLLKHIRRIATRYGKTAESFVQLAAIHRWMRFVHAA
jgi:transposase